MRVYMACRYAGMLSPIPDHHSAVRAHGSDDIRVLWLISCLVNFALMVYFLHNVEFDLRRSFLGRPSTVAPNFFTLLIVLGGVRADRVGQLTMDNLQVVLGFI